MRRIGIVAVLCVALLPLPAWPASKVKLEGYAEYYLDGVVVVDGQRVRIDRSTALEINGRARSFAALRLGYHVEVKGRRLEDGTVQAGRIDADSNRDTDVDRKLKAGFDQIEKHYLARGRMAVANDHGRIVQDYGELLTDGPLVARARRITRSLVPPYVDADEVRVYVVENDEWNAMAAPNYSIYVFSGLLDALDDDEVALVLGHELAHATHEHSRRQYSRSQWMSIGATAVAAAAAGEIDNPGTRDLAVMGTLIGASAVVNGYGRSHEDQADRVGMRYAYEAGYDVNKGPELWKKFADRYGESPVAVNYFFGDHSRSSKRAELLRDEIDHNYRDPR